MLNFDDPFEYKLLAKKYGDLMISLAMSGRNKDQIRRIITQRERQEEGRTFSQPIYEVGDYVLMITDSLNPYIGVIRSIHTNTVSRNADGDVIQCDREYSIWFEGLPKSSTPAGHSEYEAIVPAHYIMCKVDPPIKK